MLNALEKVMYPNGKTRALGDVASGSVSSIIDEVHANTTAITSITAQLSALMDDVGTNTNAITSINNRLLEITAGIDHLDLTREVTPWYEGVNLTTVFADEIAEYSDEWAWINARVQSGNFYGLHVGDYIPLITTEETPKTYNAVIMGINTYKGEGHTVTVGNHIDWIFKEGWSVNHAFNKVDYNNALSANQYPYLVSDLNMWMNSKAGNVPNEAAANPQTVSVDYTNEGVLTFLPAKLKSVITKKVMLMPKRYDASNLLDDNNSWDWVALDNLWLPSEIEICGFPVWANDGYSKGGFCLYPLFSASSMRMGVLTPSGTSANWMLSSTPSGSSDKCIVVTHDGDISTITCSYANMTVRPCFRTGGVTLTTRKKASKKKGE